MKNGDKNSNPAKKTVKKTVNLSVYDIVGDSPFLLLSDGVKVRRRILAAFKRGDCVVLSFRGVDPFAVSLPFLGAAIGNLYGKFSERDIRKLLKITDLDERGVRSVECAVRDTKSYLKDPKAYRRAMEEVLGDL